MTRRDCLRLGTAGLAFAAFPRERSWGAEWAQLETTNPTQSVEADMRRNLAFVRNLMGHRAANAG